MPINPELLDELLKEYKSPEDMFGTDGLLQQLIRLANSFCACKPFVLQVSGGKRRTDQVDFLHSPTGSTLLLFGAISRQCCEVMLFSIFFISGTAWRIAC